MEDELNMTVAKKKLGDDPVYPGQGVQLPPVILGSLGNDPTKKTVSNVTCISPQTHVPFIKILSKLN